MWKLFYFDYLRKGIFLPSELLPLGKKDKIRKKLLSFHQRLKDSLGRKRSDSQWRKFGKTTIERSKEHAQESGEPFFSTWNELDNQYVPQRLMLIF